MKNWYKSRTIWVAIIMGVSGIVIALQTQYPEVGWLVTLKAFTDVILRVFTTEPVK